MTSVLDTFVIHDLYVPEYFILRLARWLIGHDCGTPYKQFVRIWILY